MADDQMQTISTIYKYALAAPRYTDGRCVVSMPENARVCSAHEQRGEICVWAIVEPNAKIVDRVFYVVPTGAPMPPEAGLFVATVHMENGALVFHLFESNR